MDEPTKAKIRKRARALITAADLVVLVFLVFSILLAVVRRQAPSIYMDVKLSSVHWALMTSFWDYVGEKEEDLRCFLPPDREEDRMR